MWLRAFPLGLGLSTAGGIVLAMTAVAMVVSVASFSKVLGAGYAIEPKRVGIFLSGVGVFGYLLGTSLQSDFVHLLSIAIFYWGAVLFLGGTRPLISTVPGGFVLLTLIIPGESGAVGLIYQGVFTWVLIVLSVALLLTTRQHTEPLGCELCVPPERSEGSFCSSCGRLVRKVSVGLDRRRVGGFVAFSVLMIILLIPTVPLLNASPPVTFVNYGLGGIQSRSVLPLPGWVQQPQVFTFQGHRFAGYVLTQGRESIDAFVFATADPAVAGSALEEARANSTDVIPSPTSFGTQMSVYSLSQGGTNYVDVQGALSVGMLNGSQVVQTLAVIDLKQTGSLFRADNGTALYGAANRLIGWTSTSEFWSPFTATMLSVSQQLSHWIYIATISAVVVGLFTVARDDELAKVRRFESSFALSHPEAAVLEAFPPGSTWVSGAQIQESTTHATHEVPYSAFYPALRSLSDRGLVRESIVMRKGAPTLLWRSLL